MRNNKQKQRQAQRQRLAKRLKKIKELTQGITKKVAIVSLLQIASNYPKIRG